MTTSSLLGYLRTRSFERVIVLSPHLDDAALSCAALLAALPAQSRPLVVTINAGDAASERRGAYKGAPLALRRLEDARAMTALACPFIHLGFEDAIDRRDERGQPSYPNKAALWGPPAAADEAHRRELESVLGRLCCGAGPTLVLTPLAIGCHVDHRLCAETAVALQARGVGVVGYEDFPYVAAPDRHGVGGDDAAAALARLGAQGTERLVCPVDVDAKVEVLSNYPSQLEELFASTEDLRRLIESRAADGVPCEFYWRISPRSP